jgi:C-terminal processing protease CtpA/Prc
MSLDATTYRENTVAYSEIIEGTKRVGYLVYTGFETHSDEALLATLLEFYAAGVEEVILDLRINGGGAVNSAQLLASALLPASYEDAVLCEVKRNPKNKRGSVSQLFTLSAMDFNLDLDHLTVITSNQSASASELIIAGLRGLDVPVTVVGSTTNGKNCGMDVTYRTIGTTYLEYAPITFMCMNAKGESDWGDGIKPDVDVMALDETYPLPLAPWGSRYDVALMAALESVGCTVIEPKSMTKHEHFVASETIAEPIVGMRLYPDEEE